VHDRNDDVVVFSWCEHESPASRSGHQLDGLAMLSQLPVMPPSARPDRRVGVELSTRRPRRSDRRTARSVRCSVAYGLIVAVPGWSTVG
jgi:hypothetical protein